ncbi:type II toxin-antitoxin system PemK/MazF family toxin [Nocardia pseudobrasiliensis]|uniref:mRNA-degrading endonuclease toxin of MazEF toxin-antitoxin module n=1 Tax=Nocardia pseudobrasiliensis TaxID=45979 RepID=A0A370HPA6_9NOCA|nr:type II toxin-antitoxin system PemK/MazF family toxin [Nocardia pseudobrasiliensis]RDI60403.1 mRNA-degrading endonuclease toxin of MazEF toxin-antitoxin module [Nocardia pseudobrasiliensis]
MSRPTPIPRRGEIWVYLPTVSGRDKPSHLGADRVLVLSNTGANAELPTVLCVPLVTAPEAPPITVALDPADPLPHVRAAVYKTRPIPRIWLVECLGEVQRTTMQHVLGALVDYLGEY